MPTFQDLAGFWDLLQLSIEDVSMKFAELHHLKANGWKPLEPKVRGLEDMTDGETANTLSTWPEDVQYWSQNSDQYSHFLPSMLSQFKFTTEILLQTQVLTTSIAFPGSGPFVPKRPLEDLLVPS